MKKEERRKRKNARFERNKSWNRKNTVSKQAVEAVLNSLNFEDPDCVLIHGMRALDVKKIRLQPLEAHRPLNLSQYEIRDRMIYQFDKVIALEKRSERIPTPWKKFGARHKTEIDLRRSGLL